MLYLSCASFNTHSTSEIHPDVVCIFGNFGIFTRMRNKVVKCGCRLCKVNTQDNSVEEAVQQKHVGNASCLYFKTETAAPQNVQTT